MSVQFRPVPKGGVNGNSLGSWSKDKGSNPFPGFKNLIKLLESWSKTYKQKIYIYIYNYYFNKAFNGYLGSKKKDVN